MKRWMATTIALVAAALLAGDATAQGTTADKCEASKKKLSAKFYACRQKAESTVLLKGGTVDYSKCDTFADKWDAAETKADSDCPDYQTAVSMAALLTSQSNTASDALAGEELPFCGDNSVNAVGEHCDGPDLDGYDCAALGANPSGTLSCSPTCDFDASTCDPCAADGGENLGGYCWFYGASGQSCDDACTAAGRVYDPATSTYAGSDAPDASGCAALVSLFEPTAGFSGDNAGCPNGLGCIVGGAGPFFGTRCTAPPTDSSSSLAPRRICACQ